VWQMCLWMRPRCLFGQQLHAFSASSDRRAPLRCSKYSQQLGAHAAAPTTCARDSCMSRAACSRSSSAAKKALILVQHFYHEIDIHFRRPGVRRPRVGHDVRSTSVKPVFSASAHGKGSRADSATRKEIPTVASSAPSRNRPVVISIYPCQIRAAS